MMSRRPSKGRKASQYTACAPLLGGILPHRFCQKLPRCAADTNPATLPCFELRTSLDFWRGRGSLCFWPPFTAFESVYTSEQGTQGSSGVLHRRFLRPTSHATNVRAHMLQHDDCHPEGRRRIPSQRIQRGSTPRKMDEGVVDCNPDALWVSSRNLQATGANRECSSFRQTQRDLVYLHGPS